MERARGNEGGREGGGGRGARAHPAFGERRPGRVEPGHVDRRPAWRDPVPPDPLPARCAPFTPRPPPGPGRLPAAGARALAEPAARVARWVDGGWAGRGAAWGVATQ